MADGDISQAYFTTGRDPVKWLPEQAAERLRSLRQHAHDMRALIPETEVMQELRTDRAKSELRIKRLTDPAQYGGNNLDQDHPSVASERKTLDAVNAELRRLTELNEIRTAR